MDDICSTLVLPLRPINTLALYNKLPSADLPLFVEPDHRELGHTWVTRNVRLAAHGEQLALWLSGICGMLTAARALGHRWGNQGTERWRKRPLNQADILLPTWNLNSGNLLLELLFLTSRLQNTRLQKQRSK